MSIHYSISEVSERLNNLSYRTLHHWESKFELQINRDSSGNRLYTEDNVSTFEYIIELKNKGLTLDGIKRLLYDKGIIKKTEHSTAVIPVSDHSNISLNELKAVLIEDLKQVIESHYDDMNSKLEKVLDENKQLQDKLKKSEEERNLLHQELSTALLKVNNNLLALSSKRSFWKRLFCSKD